MPILTIILVLIGIGVLVWLVNKAPFIDAQYKQFIFYAVLVLVVLWILNVLGVFAALQGVRIGR